MDGIGANFSFDIDISWPSGAKRYVNSHCSFVRFKWKPNNCSRNHFLAERTNSIDSWYVESNSCDTNSESSMNKKRPLRKSSVKRRQCNVCTRVLASRQALVTHTLVHRGERPFKCDYELCEYASTSKQNLELHRNRKHINPIVACILCARKIRNIEEHMRKRNPTKLDVLSFGNQINEQHIDNSIKFSICDKTFISSKMLKVDDFIFKIKKMKANRHIRLFVVVWYI